MTPPRLLRRKVLLPLLSVLALGAGLSAHADVVPSTVDKEVLRISRYLKPIADGQWNQIAGARISEEYSIVRGDTLYGISGRLFGDPRYWPKIWALNNRSITNPHLIRPGNKIAFQTGTGTELPSVQIVPSGTATDAPGPTTGIVANPAEPHLASTSYPPDDAFVDSGEIPIDGNGRSTEWSALPMQRWEKENANAIKVMGQKSVAMGFDIKDRIQAMKSLKYEMGSFVTSEPLEPLGKITHAQVPNRYLSDHNLVFIESKSPLEIGATYQLTLNPYVLKSADEKRLGYSYLNLGKVKILKGQDGHYAGRIFGSKSWFGRGVHLVPLQPQIPILTPTGGTKPIEGRITIDPNVSTSAVAQHKQVYLDIGSADGVTQGMLFHVYQDKDPETGERIHDGKWSQLGSMVVVQVSEHYSAAIVTQSRSLLLEGMRVELEQDQLAIQAAPILEEKDELDGLDGSDELTPEEQRTLEQLENWKGNPDAGTPPPPPSDQPPPPPELPVPTESPLPDAELPPPLPEEPPPPPGDGSQAVPELPAEELPPPPPADGEMLQPAVPPPPETAPVPLQNVPLDNIAPPEPIPEPAPVPEVGTPPPAPPAPAATPQPAQGTPPAPQATPTPEPPAPDDAAALEQMINI